MEELNICKPDHVGEITQYCHNCKVYCCHCCYLETHKNHPSFELTPSLISSIQAISTSFNRFGKLKDKLFLNCDSLFQEMINKKINSAFEGLIDQINKKKEQIRKDVLSSSKLKEYTESFSNQEKSISSFLKEFRNHLNKIWEIDYPNYHKLAQLEENQLKAERFIQNRVKMSKNWVREEIENSFRIKLQIENLDFTQVIQVAHFPPKLNSSLNLSDILVLNIPTLNKSPSPKKTPIPKETQTINFKLKKWNLPIELPIQPVTDEFQCQYIKENYPITPPNQNIEKEWQLLNCGNCDWPTDTRLVSVAGVSLINQAFLHVGKIRKGQLAKIKLNFYHNELEGQFSQFFQLSTSSNFKFGPIIELKLSIPQNDNEIVATPKEEKSIEKIQKYCQATRIQCITSLRLFGQNYMKTLNYLISLENNEL